MYNAFAVWGSLNSRQVASLLARLVDGVEMWVAPAQPQGVLSKNWGGTERNPTVTCMVFKAKDNDGRKNLALGCDGFCGP
ncbi:uncharacterized protein TNCV_1439261 [Trichonephila clavipes]|nr:uncharacterized protein TNCV_1439261 [Trichonephila clavipes]